MEIKNPWPLLRAGKAEQERGLELCRQAYAQNPDDSEMMELGIALLWVEQYASAWDHFQKAIKRNPKATIDSSYGMAGVAKWCLGERREAVAEWVLGLKAKYVDAADVEMPLLLYFASVVSPEVCDKATARKLMLEKAEDELTEVWPGPIVQLILGQINEGEFLNRYERDLRDNLWQAEFYRSLMRFEPGKISDFRESMRKLADVQQPEWQDESILLARIWDEEFFLARYEAIQR